MPIYFGSVLLSLRQHWGFDAVVDLRANPFAVPPRREYFFKIISDFLQSQKSFFCQSAARSIVIATNNGSLFPAIPTYSSG